MIKSVIGFFLFVVGLIILILIVPKESVSWWWYVLFATLLGSGLDLCIDGLIDERIEILKDELRREFKR